MKHFFIIIVSFLSVFLTVNAQNPNNKWGKPSQVEWDLVAWGEAPDAEAVVLNKTMSVTYEISKSFADQNSGNLEMSFSNIGRLGSNANQVAAMTYENKLRIKVLKDSGAKFADIDIIFFEDQQYHKEYDEFGNLKVVVFSKNEKGKVARRNVKPENFTADHVGDYYKLMHIHVPDVKAGDIIEYQYTISSSRVVFLYDFSYQEDEIPVLYAKCDLDIPAFLQFDMKVPVHPYIKSTVDRGAIRMESTMGDYQAPKTFATNHYVIEGHDILPKNLEKQLIEATALSKEEEAAKFSDRLMKTIATIKNAPTAQIIQMPQDKNHIMIGHH